MSLSNGIVKILDSRRGERVSGEELGRALGVSRAAIWKSVRALRASGVPIDAVTSGGYSLSPDADILTEEKLRAGLRGAASPLRISLHESLPSTNSLAREIAESGESGDCVFVALEQTQGRGREDRRFHSPSGGGIYMSLLLHPRLTPADTLCLTTAAATAVAVAIERTVGASAGIKWVNDVFVDRRKVCGILTEASLSIESGSVRYAVVGIGINATPPKGGFPPELDGIAGAVSAGGEPDLRARLASEVINLFMEYYAALPERSFFDEYRRRLFFLGERVTVSRGDELYGATALEIDRDFRLILRRDSGETESLSSGEIRIRLG